MDCTDLRSHVCTLDNGRRPVRGERAVRERLCLVVLAPVVARMAVCGLEVKRGVRWGEVDATEDVSELFHIQGNTEYRKAEWSRMVWSVLKEGEDGSGKIINERKIGEHNLPSTLPALAELDPIVRTRRVVPQLAEIIAERRRGGSDEGSGDGEGAHIVHLYGEKRTFRG
jgi:hypothetical protein